MSRTSDTLIASIVGLILVTFAFVGFSTCEAGDQESLRTIHSAGFTDPVLGDYNAFECARGEASRSFVAANPQGARVNGVVCCSISGCTKACTLRWP
jgi:hypothetical protein